ncbi:MAG: 5-formyltetrahydrofolate cyclo-ligase [Thermoanaerobaculia bacterium]|nr:5-formyltetrahydrofolate cyclo-ligase [Thermoanaerobaculia bacterium]
MRKRLRAIPAARRRRAAERLSERVLDLFAVREAANVFLCLSFGVEIDTWHLLDGLTDLGKRTYVPRVVLDDRSFHVHPYPCRMDTLTIGLRQPAATEPELPEADLDSTLDVALILGMAFDHRGVRLGHGGGFFDRFLARHPLNTVGLAYDEQISDRLPRESHDVPMQQVVTPSRVLVPSARPAPTD